MERVVDGRWYSCVCTQLSSESVNCHDTCRSVMSL